MFDGEISDLHCHLNGSFSMKFLRQTATKNNCPEVYTRLEEVKAKYLEKTKEQPREGYPQQVIAMIWLQFGLVHQIIQTLDDITQGLVDVATNTQANYMEIRSTPKAMAGQTVAQYIDAFELGLKHVAEDSSIETELYGLLSLDRTHATFEDAQFFIERIRQSQHLCGIDISGNPEVSTRTLTGEQLTQTINHALDNNVGLGIHMGESDKAHEHQDTQTILLALEAWAEKNAPGVEAPFAGKVRIGHGIYLTQDHRARIKALLIPVEVCPTCHQHLNWHPKNAQHPATQIYPELPAPIITGTDDETIFNAGITDELTRSFNFFSKPPEMTLEAFNQMQTSYRFEARTNGAGL